MRGYTRERQKSERGRAKEKTREKDGVGRQKEREPTNRKGDTQKSGNESFHGKNPFVFIDISVGFLLALQEGSPG